jgi:hypothetical protein
MKNIISFLKKHLVVILFMFTVGSLSIAPYLLATRALGDGYQGIPLLAMDDEDIYLARMQEVLDGHEAIGSPFFYEYKDMVPLVPPIGEYLYAFPTKWLHFPLTSVALFAKFIFPALLFLMAYRLTSALIAFSDGIKHRLTALLGGIVVTFGYEPVPWNLFAWLKGHALENNLSLWTRSVNPIVGAIIVFGCLILVVDFVRSKRLRSAIVAGLIMALSVSYFFSLGTLLSVIGVLVLAYGIRREWKIVRGLIWTLAVAFLASIPYWISLFRSIGGAEGRKQSERYGMLFGHNPLLNKTLLLALFLIAVLTIIAARRERSLRRVVTQDWWIFCTAIILGGLWALNQQIVTGRTIWPYHFVQYTKPLAFVALLVAAFYAIRPRFPRAWSTGVFLLISIYLMNSGISTAGYESALDFSRRQQAYAPVFRWLNANMPVDCVALVDEKEELLARLIPAFSHCNVYRSSIIFGGVTEERIFHNYLVYLRLQGVIPETVREHIRTNPYDIRGNFFDNWKTLFTKERSPWLDMKTEEVVQGYTEFYARDFSKELRRYRLDVLWSDKGFSPEECQSLGLKPDPERIGNWFVYLLE